MRIRSSFGAIGAVLAVASISHAAPVRVIMPKGAVSFTSKPQKFAVWLPTKPSQGKSPVRFKRGEKSTAYIFVADSKEISYLVIAVSTAGVPQSSSGNLDAEQRSFLASSGGTLMKSENVRLSGFSGREILVKSPIGRVARARIFITPKSRYVLMAQSEPADAKKQKSQIDRFFDSFRILPQ